MSFSELYRNKSRVFSFEFFPPKKEQDLAGTKDLIRRMAGLNPDFMTVTYGAGGGTRVRTEELVSFIVNELDHAAAAHLTCVHHSVEEIDLLLNSLHAKGIRHIVALRGDPSNDPNLKGELFPGFRCARDLVRHIRHRGDFSVAVAGYPEKHPDAETFEADISYLVEKIDAGADMVVTQLFFDPGYYFSFVERAWKAGVRVPIVPGVLPIAGARQLQNINARCRASVPSEVSRTLARISGDASAEHDFGIEYALKLSEQLLVGGAPGIHFYTLNKSSQVEEVLKCLLH